jgi:hypothetical protein
MVLFTHKCTSHIQVDTSESKVCLWIGASTMVEYTYEEGKQYYNNILSWLYLLFTWLLLR